MSREPVKPKPQPRPPTYPVVLDASDEEADLGTIQIHNSVIAIIARIAAVKVEGVSDVVGSLVEDVAGKIGIRQADRGVHVEIDGDRIRLNLSLAVDYGVFIPRICFEVQTQVRRAVEEMTGKTVKTVNVVVRSLRVPNRPQPEPVDDFGPEMT